MHLARDERRRLRAEGRLVDEPKSSDDASDESTQERETSPWVIAGVYGALGFEFVGFIVGGYLVGQAIDEWLGSYPVATLACIALGLVGVLWHTYRISKRFLE